MKLLPGRLARRSPRYDEASKVRARPLRLENLAHDFAVAQHVADRAVGAVQEFVHVGILKLSPRPS